MAILGIFRIGRLRRYEAKRRSAGGITYEGLPIFDVDGYFKVDRDRVVATGTVASGMFRKGDYVVIDGEITARISAIESLRNVVRDIGEGQSGALVLSGVSPSLLSKQAIIEALPNAI